ncbi:MAG: hypothetical protein M1541_12060 [Acidobacteria bacterium]|nr:hypothetical protein [Acidobacteriota bacterium]
MDVQNTKIGQFPVACAGTTAAMREPGNTNFDFPVHRRFSVKELASVEFTSIQFGLKLL